MSDGESRGEKASAPGQRRAAKKKATAAPSSNGALPEQKEVAERRFQTPQGGTEEKPEADGVCGGGVHD
jgi:hypothetical protein